MKKIPLLFAILLMASQLSHAQSVTLATTTVNPTKGTVVYNNTTNQLQYWNGSAWIPVTNAAAGTGWALNGTNIYKSNSGNVGIGINTPANMLQIGSVGSTGMSGYNFALGDGFEAFGISQGFYSTFMSSSTDISLNPRSGSGNVGINIYYPENKLQIGSVGSSNFNGNDIAYGNGTQVTGLYQAGTSSNIATTTDLILLPRYGGSTWGRVGINTTAPRAPLDVIGGINETLAYAFFYLNTSNGQHVIGSTPPANSAISIYSQYSIASSSFIAYSDARIKNIAGISNSAQDLATIRALQITDYTMKDQLQYGNKPYKKVIAQQVEKVYPQAVSKVTDVVPDIYILAENVVFHEANKTLKCFLTKEYDIKVGEKMQFIHPKEGKLKAEVIEVSGNSFTVKDWQHPTDKIFVYGREVNDFRSVDYEAISMLGISAIQQLAKENEELKAKNNEFNRKFEQLSARLEALESQLPKVPTGK